MYVSDQRQRATCQPRDPPQSVVPPGQDPLKGLASAWFVPAFPGGGWCLEEPASSTGTMNEAGS